MQTGA